MAKNIITPTPQQTSHKKYYLLLVLVVVVVFANTLFNGYNLDDNLVTINHPYTSKGLKAIGKIFTSSYYTNQADISFGYRPMVHLSFALEHQFFGQKPGVSHFFNLLIYLGCVLGFFKLLLNWFGEKGLNFALLAALIFAVHPVHTEAVASIKNRDELLAFGFVILSLNQLNRFIQKQQWHSVLLALVFFICALLSKKSVYPVVFILPLVFVFIKGESLQSVVKLTLLYSAAGGVFASDFTPTRMVLLVVAPILFLGLIVIYQKRLSIIAKLKTPKVSQVLYALFSLVSWVLLVQFKIQYEYVFCLFAIGVSTAIFIKSGCNKIYLGQVVLQLLCLSILSNNIAFSYIGYTFLLVGYLNQTIGKKEKFLFWVILSVVLAVLLFLQPKITTAVVALNLALVAFLFNQKKMIAAILLLLNLIITAVIYKPEYNQISLLLLMVLIMIPENLKAKINVSLVVLLLLIPFLFFKNTPRRIVSSYIEQYKASPTLSIEQTPISGGIAMPFSEGRSLSYVENTLVGNQSFEAKFTTGVVVLGEYVRLLVFPYQLSFYYGFATIKTSSYADIYFWISFLVLLTLMGVALFYFKRNKLVFIGLVWFFVCILLFSNWLELVAGMVGERLAFLASAGFCLFIAALFAQYKKEIDVKKLGSVEYVLIAILVLFSARTMARNSDWKSQLSLIENDIEHLESGAYTNHIYALTCMNVLSTSQNISQSTYNELLSKAEIAFIRSIEIYPKYFNANFDLARFYLMKENLPKAKMQLEICCKLDSNNLFVLEQLAVTCYKLNLLNEAEQRGNQYLGLYPENENMHELMVYIAITNKQPDKAEVYLRNGFIYFPSSNKLNALKGEIEKLKAPALINP